MPVARRLHARSDQCDAVGEGTGGSRAYLKAGQQERANSGDYRYSTGIVYNNFPWPDSPTDKPKQAIEQAAQHVLDARAKFPNATLADLYDPVTMPPELAKAHQQLDKAVDAAYGKTTFKSDAERVAFLFGLYQKYTSLLPADKPKRITRTKLKSQHAR